MSSGIWWVLLILVRNGFNLFVVSGEVVRVVCSVGCRLLVVGRLVWCIVWMVWLGRKWVGLL